MLRNKLKLFFLSQIMLILALAFNAGLNIGSLKKVYTELLTARFHVVGLDTRINIEKGVQLGKLLDIFGGLDEIVHSVTEKLPELSDVLVIMSDGRPVSFTGEKVQSEAIGKSVQRFYSKATTTHGREGSFAADERYVVFKARDFHHLVFPIKDRSRKLTGMLVLRFNDKIIDALVMGVLKEQAVVLGLTALAAGLVLFLGLLLLNGFSKTKEANRQDKRAYPVIMLVLIGAQIYFSYHSATIFRSENISAINKQVATQAVLFKKDLERKVLSKGIPIERLRGIEKRLAEMVRSNGDIASMQIFNLDGKILNMADSEGAVSRDKVLALGNVSITESAYESTLTLLGKKGGVSDQPVGYLRTTIAKTEIIKRVREIMYDSITIILLSILFILEMKFFLLFFMNSSSQTTVPAAEPKIEPYKFARPAAFLFLFAWALPLSFIPLKMETIYAPFPGISKDLVLGLPISIEMLCALFTALIAGGMTDRHGWHVPFVGGLLLAAAGSLLSAMATAPVPFIVYRGIAGLGYGLAWMAIQGFIFHNSTEKNRALGYSTLVAGIFAGLICGTAVGAMLAERFGYDFVFVISAGLMTVPLGFVIIFMFRYMKRPAAIQAVPDVPLIDTLKLLVNKDFFSIMMLSVVPLSICQVGLLYYAVPIYLKASAVSQSTIGRVLMVYGLSVIFLAPRISRFMDRSRRKKKYIILGGLVGSLGLISLYFISGMTGVLIAVFMLGFSSCLSSPAQPALALKIKLAQRVGRGRSMSIQRAADKLGQMAGPLFVGFLVASVGIEQSVVFTGLTFLAATLMFALIMKESKNQSE